MAITVDYTVTPHCIQVPQSDLTLVSGTLYELDTDWLFDQIKAWEANHIGMVFQDMQSHNVEYTVQGVTYAQKVEILNSSNSSNTDEFCILFTPDTLYSVRLTGSNNNIADIQNAILANTTTQIIPGNSAGLIKGEITDQTVEGALTVQDSLKVILAAVSGKLSGAGTGTVTIRDTQDTLDRIVATTDDSGNRITVTLDLS